MTIIIIQIGNQLAFIFTDSHYYKFTFRKSFGNVPVNGGDEVDDKTADIGTNRDISFLDDSLAAGGQAIFGVDGVTDAVEIVVIVSLSWSY